MPEKINEEKKKKATQKVVYEEMNYSSEMVRLFGNSVRRCLQTAFAFVQILVLISVRVATWRSDSSSDRLCSIP